MSTFVCVMFDHGVCKVHNCITFYFRLMLTKILSLTCSQRAEDLPHFRYSIGTEMRIGQLFCISRYIHTVQSANGGLKMAHPHY